MRSQFDGHGMAEVATEATAAAITLALVVLLLVKPVRMTDIPLPPCKATQVVLAVVEESPPPPVPPPPPDVTSPLPLPPPPPLHRIVHARPAQRPLRQPVEPLVEQPSPQAPSPARSVPQASENRSADAAYVGRLHAIVARGTTPPSSSAYRLSHPTGEVEIGFTLSRAGVVSDVHVLRSSGSTLLDQQGVLIVSDQSYPAIPPDVFPGTPSHAFSVPVAFTDEGAAEGL